METGDAQKYFAALGLELNREYSAEDLKTAWRNKCMENHPDKGGDKAAFIEVNHAYKMLSDPSYRENQKKIKSSDLEIKIVVPIRFEDAFFGNRVSAKWNQIEVDDKFQPIFKEEQEICVTSIMFPMGHMQEFVQLVPGKGLKHGDGAGNALIFFRPTASERFKVQGRDVFTQEHIPLDVLIRGGKIEVQTMWGLRTLAIPAGTLPGEKLKLKSCGVGQGGFHYVECLPVFPNQESLRTNEAWKGLDINWTESEEAIKKQNEQDFYFEQVYQGMNGSSFTYTTSL